jgi:hypothetical protein
LIKETDIKKPLERGLVLTLKHLSKDILKDFSQIDSANRVKYTYIDYLGEYRFKLEAICTFFTGSDFSHEKILDDIGGVFKYMKEIAFRLSESGGVTSKPTMLAAATSGLWEKLEELYTKELMLGELGRVVSSNESRFKSWTCKVPANIASSIRPPKFQF